ncbi:hypothetical protein [Prosthecobacter sp.]|uniref:hypothetical protein n=1 Tax=Prosthecobacter sp. TaxID=1965333 RepID=UPI00248A8502|nr:hypothetical protein [Prosthecobacter sp.]MDI1310531.1 hypothetical protein [Prosthecobacter sp.]
MNTRRTTLKRLIALACLLGVSYLMLPTPVQAAHDHDHFNVTMVAYVGYQRDSQHYIIKVKDVTKDGAAFYFLHFLQDASSLRGHEGEQMQISLSKDGTRWDRFSFGRHGTWNIHEREMAK